MGTYSIDIDILIMVMRMMMFSSNMVDSEFPMYFL